MKHEEFHIQKQFVDYLKWRGIRCHHSPNEAKRDARQGHDLKMLGMSAGFPDLFIPKASHQWAGLFIEFKASQGRISASQKDWLDYLNGEGFVAVVARSCDEAIAIFESYMMGDESAWQK